MSAVLQDRPEPGTVDLTRSLPGQEALLTPAAQTFLAGLHVRFEGDRQARLAARRARQACFDAGALPDFRDDTASIRAFGLDVIARLCEQLRSGGAPALHFYTMNQSATTLELCRRLAA